MATVLGDFLRKLRLENGEILKDMAKKLEVSSAFLSAVENGKKKMPESWYSKLEELYNLNDTQQDKLKEAVMESSDVIELNIHNSSYDGRLLAISFARKFDSLDDETSRAITEILNKHIEV